MPLSRLVNKTFLFTYMQILQCQAMEILEPSIVMAIREYIVATIII